MPDLCVIQDVKDWLGIGVATTEDDLLKRLITATSNDMLGMMSRFDLSPAADYVEPRRGNGDKRMLLHHWPINTVASVTIDSVAIVASPDGVQNGFVIDADPDPEMRLGITLIGSRFTKRISPYSSTSLNFPNAPDPNVVVTYNAGYAANVLPTSIVQAAIDWVSYRYRSRQWIGQTSKHMNVGEVVQFRNVLMPDTTAAVIERYERIARILND